MGESSYNTNNITGLLISETTPNGIEKKYTYNNKKQLTSITKKDLVLEYNYNDKNLLTNIIQGTKDYKLIYDDFLKVKETKLNNKTLTINEYADNNGNLIKTTYGNGQFIKLGYDDFDRLNKLIKMDDTYNYYYDTTSNIAKVMSNKENKKLYYDISNRLCTYKNNNFVVKYTYDSENNIINEIHRLNNKIHIKTNVLDINERLVSTSLDDITVTYGYDGLNRNINKNINNIIENQYKFLSNGKRTTELITEHKINNDIYKYVYDKSFNIIDIYFNNTLVKHELITEFNYDMNVSINYNYDLFGNILTKTTKNITSNDIIKESLYEYSNIDMKDQLTKFDNKNITYDDIGNFVNYGNKNFTWINGTELSLYSDANNNKMLYINIIIKELDFLRKVQR